MSKKAEPFQNIPLYKYIPNQIDCQGRIYLLEYIGVMKMIRICLDKTLERLGVSRYELAKRTGIQYQVIDNYYKNKVKRYDGFVLERICSALDCDIGDVIEYNK